MRHHEGLFPGCRAGDLLAVSLGAERGWGQVCGHWAQPDAAAAWLWHGGLWLTVLGWGTPAQWGLGTGASFQPLWGCGCRWRGPVCGAGAVHGHRQGDGAAQPCLSRALPSLATGNCKKLHEILTALPESPGSGLNGAAGAGHAATSQLVAFRGLQLNNPRDSTSVIPSWGTAGSWPSWHVGWMLFASITANARGSCRRAKD